MVGMKVSDLLEQRRGNWQKLDQLTKQVESRARRRMSAVEFSQFASLYRSACADLALADAYQLPPGTVQYLHRLVGRAHNQLYRSRKFDFAAWRRMLLIDVPQRIFHDRCVQLAFALFWGIFLLAAAMSYHDRPFAEEMMGEAMLTQLQDSFQWTGRRTARGQPPPWPVSTSNTTRVSVCSVLPAGLLVIPGVAVTIFNSAVLGAAFGYMARPDVPQTDNFFHFVTAHGPFELTAIVLSAGAGLRLGMAWLAPFARGVRTAVGDVAAVDMAMWKSRRPTPASRRCDSRPWKRCR